MFRLSLPLPLLVAAAVATVLVAGGCSSLPMAGVNGLLDTGRRRGAGQETAGAAEAVPYCTVELRRTERPVEPVQVPLSGDVRLQDVLEATRAVKKFDDMELTILRPAPGAPGQRIKLSSHFDRRQKRVRLESDYAIMPGDHIVVQERHYTIVDEIVDGVMGPIFGGTD